MKRNVKTKIVADGLEGFFGRAREHARRIDRGDEVGSEVTVSFEDPADMMRVLSAERIRLLKAARQRPTAVSELAQGLQRDTRAVSRDVDLLESFGLLDTRYESNPGHGKRRVVSVRAPKFRLVANI